MNFKQRSGTCDEATFWECVAEIDWPVENTDLVKAAILRAWTPEFGTSFRKIMEEKVGEVYKVIEVSEKELSQEVRDSYYLSDDGLSDFCNHIVGMGWNTFQSELADPSKLFARAAANDYQESFSYVVPYEPSTTDSFEDWSTSHKHDLRKESFDPHYMDELTYEAYIASLREAWEESRKGDWRKIEPDHYAKHAEQYLPTTAAFLAELETPTTDEERAAIDLAGTLVRYLNLLIQEKTEEALAMSEGALKAWWGLYHIASDLKALREKHVDLLPMSGTMTYGGENLINDHREFMGGLEGFKCQFHLKKIRDKAKRAS